VEKGAKQLPLAVVVNWNGGELVEQALASLVRCRRQVPLPVHLVDNASSDGSREELVEKYGGEPWFSHEVNRTNVGYAPAANQGMSRALEQGRDVLLFNPDAQMEPESLQLLMEGLERCPRTAVAAPRLLNPDGTLQPSMRDDPTPRNLALEHLLEGRARSKRVAVFDPHREERSADWIVGAVWLVRREALEETGLFDEGYGTFHEETDLARRFRDRGWDLRLFPGAAAVHVGGGLAAGPAGGHQDLILRYIPGKLRFLRKHEGPLSLPAFRAGISLLWIARMFSIPWGAEKRARSKKALQLIWGPPAGE
jgi:N-acetylglucosaminyl-diphospho-decaprenol L-rhamnosyltransferase